MLFNHSRHRSRTDPAGELVVLDEQDRSLWDQTMITEAITLLDSSRPIEPPGPYQAQAQIAQVHSVAATPKDVAWPAIVGLYERLHDLLASPIVLLNRASAISMGEGPEAGLAALAAIERDGGLEGYHYLHAAKADFLRRCGRRGEALASYRRAPALCANPVETRFLERRVNELVKR